MHTDICPIHIKFIRQVQRALYWKLQSCMQPTNVLLIRGFFGSDKESLNTSSNTVFTIKITHSYNNAPKTVDYIHILAFIQHNKNNSFGYCWT